MAYNFVRNSPQKYKILAQFSQNIFTLKIQVLFIHSQILLNEAEKKWAFESKWDTPNHLALSYFTVSFH